MANISITATRKLAERLAVWQVATNQQGTDSKYLLTKVKDVRGVAEACAHAGIKISKSRVSECIQLGNWLLHNTTYKGRAAPFGLPTPGPGDGADRRNLMAHAVPGDIMLHKLPDELDRLGVNDPSLRAIIGGAAQPPAPAPAVIDSSQLSRKMLQAQPDLIQPGDEVTILPKGHPDLHVDYESGAGTTYLVARVDPDGDIQVSGPPFGGREFIVLPCSDGSGFYQRSPVDRVTRNGVVIAQRPDTNTNTSQEEDTTMASITDQAEAAVAEATPTNDLSDLSGLSDMLAKVPALVNRNKELERVNQELRTTATEAEKKSIEKDRALQDALHEVTHTKDKVSELSAKVAELSARPTGTTSITVVTSNHDDAADINDLDRIATACGITRQELDDQMTAFKDNCAFSLPNAVDWPEWCDPNNKFSRLVWAYDNGEVTACTGPSGTGKTFIMEALAHMKAGMRSLISYHANLTYPKLFAKERVSHGKTFWQLGPIPMAALCGVPIIHDEFDHADVFVQSLVHSILDSGCVHLPDVGLTIQPLGGVRHLFTCNSLTDSEGVYHGEVGTALKTRLGAIYVGYPTQRQESKTIRVAADVSAPIANKIAAAFAALRQAEEIDGSLTGPFSVRESVAVARRMKKAMDQGADYETAAHLGFDSMVIEKRPTDEFTVAREVVTQAGAFSAPPSGAPPIGEQPETPEPATTEEQDGFLNKLKAAGVVAD